MSNFPSDFDDDTTLPFVNDNITEIGGEAINALRDAIFNIEQEIGIGIDGYTQASGTCGSIAVRLGISLNPNGTIKPSAIASLGLVTLPITNSQIDDNANILESKLRLDYRTSDLFTYIRELANNINTSLGWISISGMKLEPHLAGVIYRHSLDDLDISTDASNYLTNRFRSYRDNSDLFKLLTDMNSELLAHQFADGSPIDGRTITTNNGSTYTADYAHTSSGIFLNTSRFAVIPQTAQDLQQFADFIDQSSVFLYGTRIQNLYSNGVSRVSRSISLTSDIDGTNIVSDTPAITYLSSTSPFDDIDSGDDIVKFVPTGAAVTTNSFAAQFAAVKVGDVIHINYGLVDGYSTVEADFIVKEKKYMQVGDDLTYIIRIDGKNLYASTNATVRINKPLFNNNKFGVLAVAAANNPGGFAIPSLIVGNPRAAMALGLGFNPDQLDSTHYALYLALYPTGNPQDGYSFLPSIDVTGNQGTTPGKYTLESIAETINTAFRQPGYNYRFIAFTYQGELGIMLADSYHNSGFSILNAVVDGYGFYDSLATSVSFPNNVVGVFATSPQVAPDPLGFGFNGASIASPPFMPIYGSPEAAQNPTKLFLPLKRNNYYVNGAEKDTLSLDVGQALDEYGDGYWLGTMTSRTLTPGVRVQVTYRIPLDLKQSRLCVGKTLVVQSAGSGSFVDYGRFIIKTINFGCDPDNPYTDITVYDAVHANGGYTSATATSGTFAIYFDYSSVSFNEENATDNAAYSSFKRYFEVYVDQNGRTFTHERGRININGAPLTVNGVSLRSTTGTSKINIIKISPKLRGYQSGSVTRISLKLSANSTTGEISGSLSSYDGYHSGLVAYGRKGVPLRIYDETNIDYIEIIIDNDTAFATFTNETIDIQLFPSLSLDDELMLLATCQLDNTNYVRWLRDDRQFGNTSEKDFTTSALNFISSTDRAVHANGVVRGFDLLNTLSDPNPNGQQIYLNGGVALVNGNLIQKNSETVVIPVLKEVISATYYDINWALCVNDKGEYQTIPLLDYDPILSTPINPLRTFTAYNPDPAILSTYAIEASTFSTIVNTRKDLTILYIVASTVTYPTFSLAINDCRRFADNVENNLPLRYDQRGTQSNGNFKDADSLFNWLKYNGTFNGQVVLKSDEHLEVNSKVILGGDNCAIIIDGENLGETYIEFNDTVTLKSNVTFKNITISFRGQVITESGISNVKFDNCFIYWNQTAISSGHIFLNIDNAYNVSFVDCGMTASFTNAHSQNGVLFYVANTSKYGFSLINTYMTTTFLVSAPTAAGTVVMLDNSAGVIIKHCEFIGNFRCAVYFGNDCHGLQITDSEMWSNFDPNTYSGAGYTSSNLVNTGNGFIYANVSSNLNDALIQNTIFNYDGSSSNRYSFINFELTNNTSVINNLRISGCRFNHISAAGSIDDIRAAIAIINTTSIGSSHYPTYAQPIVQDAVISNNVCNRNQSIILSTVTDGTYMYSPALVAINCTISNNICGTIGYWVGTGTKYSNLSPNVNSWNDKTSNLVIENNVCHYIASMMSDGKYFAATSIISATTTNMCSYPSGNVIIRGNSANWIHTAVTFEENSSLKILDNNLTAYNYTYLTLMGVTLSELATAVNYAAIYVSSNKHIDYATLTPSESNGTCCVISNNTTNSGYYVQTNLTTVTYVYKYSCIACACSATITNNILKGITGIDGVGNLILINGKVNIVKNNQLFRGSAYISHYIEAGFKDSLIDGAASWTMNNTFGIITENYFDSPTISPPSTDTDTINVPNVPTHVADTSWIVERNINQTVTRKLRIMAARHICKNEYSGYRIWGDLYSGLSTELDAAFESYFIVKYDHTSSGGVTREYHLLFELTHMLPPEVKLIEVTAPTTLTMSSGLPYSGTSSNLTVRNSINGGANKNESDWHTYTSTPESYDLTLTESILVDYINSINGYLFVEVTAILFDGSNNIDFQFEPVEVKYRW